jgi:hypothetical protein
MRGILNRNLQDSKVCLGNVTLIPSSELPEILRLSVRLVSPESNQKMSARARATAQFVRKVRRAGTGQTRHLFQPAAVMNVTELNLLPFHKIFSTGNKVGVVFHLELAGGDSTFTTLSHTSV